MRLSQLVGWACGAALISGCQTLPVSDSKTTLAAPLTVATLPLANCFSTYSKESIPFATLVTPAFSKVAKSLGDALVSWSGKNDIQYVTTGRLNGYLYTYKEGGANEEDQMDLHDSIKCIQVTSASPSVLRFVFGVKKSDDNTAFEIIPTDLTYSNPLGHDRNVVSMNATVDIKTPDGKNVATAVLPLNAIPGQSYTSATLNTAMSGWMTLPATSSDAKSVITSLQQLKSTGTSPPEKIGALQRRLRSNTPVTVEVTITETRSYDAFMAAVGQFLSDNSADVGKELGTQVTAKKQP